MGEAVKMVFEITYDVMPAFPIEKYPFNMLREMSEK